jgi:hypothetical protein
MTNTIEFLYNNCHGGFSFSDDFRAILCENRHDHDHDDYDYDYTRFDAHVIELVKKFDKICSGKYATIEIASVTFPECINIEYIKKSVQFNEYDGLERPFFNIPLLMKIMIDAKCFKTMEELYTMNCIINNIKIKR